MTIQQIKHAVYVVYRECNIQSFPVRPDLILQQCGYQLYTYEGIKNTHPELYALCKACSEDAFTHKKTRKTIVKHNVVIGRLRFSLAHELGHVLLDNMVTGSQQNREDVADLFASHLLVPRIAISIEGCKNAQDIHDVFGLSYAAANKTWIGYTQKSESILSDIDYKIGDLLYLSQEERSQWEFFENISPLVVQLCLNKSTCKNNMEENL